MGNPNPEFTDASFAERQNLTIRISMRRFTRWMKVFAKKIQNYRHALVLYFVFYNFVASVRHLS